MGMKKIITVCIVAQSLIASQAAQAATQADPFPEGKDVRAFRRNAQAEEDLSAGLRNYRAAHYRKALQYFGKVERKALDRERAEFYDYIMKVMTSYKDRLYEIEKAEASLRGAGGDALAAQVIAAAHVTVADDLMKGRFYLAIVEPHLKKAAALMPSDGSIRTRLGDAYYSSMRYYDAVKSYEKAAQSDKGNVYALKMEADAFVALGDFDKAKELYKKFLQSVKEAAAAYPADEIGKTERVLAALPETYKDVEQLLKEERADEAEVVLKKRLSLNPGDYVAMTMLGVIYQDRGEKKAALDIFRKVVKTVPDYPVAHLYLGRLYFIMRKNDDAVTELRLFKEKMAILPKMDDETKKMYKDGLFYLSEVYFTLEMHAESKRELDNILKLDPKDQGAYYNLGIYYYKYEHSRPKAYQAFKKAADLDPSSGTGKNAVYAIEFIRANPDSRITPDFSFINREYRD